MNILRESLVVRRAMRHLEARHENLLKEEALFADPLTGSVASMFVLGNNGVEFDDVRLRSIESAMAGLMHTYGVSAECIQQVLHRHEPELAQEENERKYD